MAEYSFIDFGLRDFLREADGSVIIVKVNNYAEAEAWLLENGEDHGWTNEGIRYWEWGSEENGDDNDS